MWTYHHTSPAPYLLTVMCQPSFIEQVIKPSTSSSRNRIPSPVLLMNPFYHYLRMIDFTKVSDQQLASLEAACQPATFGVAQKDVLDESYRKAGKMDVSEFAAQFSPTSSGILEGIRKSLFMGRTNESIRVELYKLNVYGTSCSFLFYPSA